MKKRLSCLLLSGVMAFSMLTGCSALPFGKEPVTAESLVSNAFGDEKDSKSMDVGIKLGIDAEMDLAEMGMDGTMELSIALDADMKANKDYVHMEGDAEIKLFGMKIEQEINEYYDYGDGIQYSYDSEDDIWTYSDIDDEDGSMADIADAFKDGIFKKLELKEHKKGEDYVVAGKLEYEDFEELAGSGMTGDFESMNDMLEDMAFNIEMSFDEKTKTIKSLDMDIDVDEIEGANISSFYVNFTFNQIGGDIDISIPKKVIKNAVAEDEEDGDDSDIRLTEEGIEYYDPYDHSDLPYPCNEIPVVSENGGSDRPEPQAQANETAKPEAPANAGGQLGIFGNTPFAGGMSPDVFIGDGWDLDGTFEGIFVPAENAKYDEASLYLYGRKDPVSVEDLKADGIWGYDLNVAYCGDALPAYSIGGLTWGASADDIKNTFGEPDDEFDTTFYSSILTYELSDGTEVQFSVTQDNAYGIDGMVAVSVVNYGIID